MKTKTPYLVIATLIVFGLIIALVLILNNNSSQSEEVKSIDIEGQPILGDENAPVTIVEFGDYKCPSCKAWGEMIFPQLFKDYIEPGTVKLSYINTPFHGTESELAAAAAEAVYDQNENIYWLFHHALFNAQPAEDHDALWVTPEKMLEIAKEFPEIDQDQLKTAIENETTMEEVDHDTDLVREFGVAYTPTIVVNGITLEDPFDYDGLKKLIDEELKGNE